MRKPFLRIITLILAAVLALGTLLGTLAMIVNAADDDADDVATTEDDRIRIITADTTVSKTLTVGRVTTGITIKFRFLSEYAPSIKSYEFNEFYMPVSSSFGWSEKTKLTIKADSKNSDAYDATLTNVTYNGGSTRALEMHIIDGDYDFYVPISNKYFKESSDAEGEPPTSDIVVQGVHVKNASGQQLSKVDKDTAPFNIEIVFYDVGLMDEPASEVESAAKHVFITSAAGFRTLSGTVGTIVQIDTKTKYPRFRATFKNITSDGTATELGFRVQYDLSEYESSVKGTATATLFQVGVDSEDDETAPLIPRLIISSYDYGDEPIVAGGEFNLDMTLQNTSETVGVENVEMTIEPGNGFVIAAASNTAYFQHLAPGDEKPYSVALKAAPSGNVADTQTDYSVTVAFKYQYLSKKEYASGEATVKIAIPVAQLDRFTVDEITDYSQYVTMGEEGYITVQMTNKGKSSTMNISGEIKAADENAFVSAPVHFGNLEAGNSGTMDFSITVNVPGEFSGEVLVTYEDENMDMKETRVPFQIMVSEPFMPPPPDDALGPEAGQSTGGGTWPVASMIAGGLFIAAPVALYIIKRVKVKGAEEFDEDF